MGACSSSQPPPPQQQSPSVTAKGGSDATAPQELAASNPLNQLNLALITTDAMGLILHGNAAACRFLGYEQLTGRHVESIMPFHIATHHAGYMKRYHDNPTDARIIGGLGRKVKVRCANGNERPALLTIAPTGAGGFSAALLSLEAVERAKQSELAVRAAEQVTHDRTQFITYLSHEIRVPMNALCMGISMLAEGNVADLHPPVKEAVAQGMPTLASQCDDLRNCCESILHLLNDVLDMEKMRSGVYVYSYGPMDLSSVSKRAQSMASMGVSGACTISFDRVAPPQITAYRVWCDGHRLLQVLGNFLSNAVRHTNPGGVVRQTFTWMWRQDDPDPDKEAAARARFNCPPEARGVDLRLEVWNSGSFIAPEQVHHVFNPFVQLPPSPAAAGSGGSLPGGDGGGGSGGVERAPSVSRVTGKRTGIGLSICQQIVQVGHFGTIFANSDDTGTSFVAAMPLYAIPQGTPRPAASAASAAATRQQQQQPRAEAAAASKNNTQGSGGNSTKSMAVETKEEGGTETPPERLSPASAAAATAERKREAEAAGPSTTTVDVLYVDDSRMNTKMVARMLVSEGITCHTAENGQLAVEWFRGGSTCKLVLMDRTMPVMDGVQATKLIKAMLPGLSVVGLTGDAQSSPVSDMRAAGAEYIMVKPVFKEQLLKVVKAYIP